MTLHAYEYSTRRHGRLRYYNDLLPGGGEGLGRLEGEGKDGDEPRYVREGENTQVGNEERLRCVHSTF